MLFIKFLLIILGFRIRALFVYLWTFSSTIWFFNSFYFLKSEMCKTHCGLWLVGRYDSGVTGRSSLCNRWARPAVFRLFRLIYSNKLWYQNLKAVPFLDVKTLGADQKSYYWKFEKKRGRFRPRTAWLRRYFASERKTKGGVISTLPNFKFLFFSDLRFYSRCIKSIGYETGNIIDFQNHFF